MRMLGWIGSLFAGGVLLVGCAREVKQDEARLGMIGIDQKQEIFTAQHNLTVAQANKQAAEAARDEHKAFVKVSDDELAAAKARMEASKSASELAQKTGDRAAMRDAQRALDVATRQIVAAKAKKDYADHLADLRDAEVELGDRQIAEADAELALVRTRALRRNGITPSEDEGGLLSRRDRLNSELASQERKIAGQRDDVNRFRIAWDDRRQDFNTAQRELPVPSTVKAPAAPRRIAPEPIPEERESPSDTARDRM